MQEPIILDPLLDSCVCIVSQNQKQTPHLEENIKTLPTNKINAQK